MGSLSMTAYTVGAAAPATHDVDPPPPAASGPTRRDEHLSAVSDRAVCALSRSPRRDQLAVAFDFRAPAALRVEREAAFFAGAAASGSVCGCSSLELTSIA